MTNDISTHRPADLPMTFQSIVQTLLADPNVGARRMNLSSGTVVYEPDAAADTLHFIHRGQVRLYQVGEQDATRLCEILGPDEWIGVGALAGAEAQGVRAVAVGPTVVTEINATRFLAAMAKFPQALIEFNRQVASKLQSAREDAAELIFRDTNARLINILLRFSQSAASTQREDGVVLNITHSQLAQAVGAARETISLALTQLRHQNLVRTGRNQLFFNPVLLSRLQEAGQAEVESAA